MNKKISRSGVLVTVIVLITSIALIIGTLFSFFEEQIQNELKSEANYLSYAVETDGAEYIENFSDASHRLTLISPSGEVIADTSADASALENHSDRVEFKEALENGSSTSVRYSDTLTRKTIYYALRLSDGSVLRVSTTYSSIITILRGFIQPFLIVLVIAVIISFLIFNLTERKKREQLRREFTSNVSHELKTPLTSISGFAELMKNGDIPPETVVDFSNSIYDEAQRLISLVGDILKLSELDEGKAVGESETVDLYELSEKIIERLKSEAAKKNITMNLTGVRAEISGTRRILDEMIYNLCDNAIKYNKENGEVDIIINTIENRVRLTVRDTGIGIPAPEQERVFERFYRVDKSHSKAVGGTGLGLAIVKHGAASHNAEITLDSTVGKGTSVTLEFKKRTK